MAFALSGSIITQSGTDANPSGLGAIAGVTTQSFGTGSRIRTIYTIPAGRQLAITGTLTHDTDQYLILFSDNAANTGSLTKIIVTGTYNYGIKANGQPSSLSGISIPSDPGTWWAPAIVASGLNGNAILVTGSGARFNMQGGQIDGALTIGYGNSAGGTISSGTVVVRDDGITNGTNWLTRILTPNLAFNGYTMIGGSLSIGANTAGQTFSISRLGAGGVAYWLQTQSATPTRIKDYVVGAGYEVGIAPYSDGVGGVNCVPTVSQNSAAGTAVNLRGGESAPSGDIANAGYHAFLRTISTSITTESSLADGFIYVRDTNNGQRKNLNSIDDTPDKIYIGTITSGALSAWSKIGGGGLVYASNYEIISGIVNVVRNATNTRGESNVGIWRKDLRGLSDVEGEDRFNFYVWSYANQYKVINQTLAGAGTLVLTDKVFVDSGVTLSNSAALAKLASSFTINTSTNTITVTASSTLDDVYDALKAYKCQAIQANLEYPTISTQPVTASGTTIVTAMNVVVNSGVTLSSGAKFTSLSTSGTFTSAGVIATAIVGSVTTTGTFASGASVTGNVTQATPTNLSGVTITGSLTYNSAAATVTFTNCNVSGTISNSGAGLVKVVKAGSTPWLTGGTNVSVITNVIVETPGGLPLSTYIVKNGSTDLGWVATNAARSLEIQESDTFSIYAIAYGYKAKLISATATDLTSFKFELLPEPYIDTSLSTVTRDFITSKFSTALDAYNRIALSLDYDLRYYTPDEVMNAVQWYITTEGDLIAAGVLYGGTIDGVEIIQGGIVIGTPGFYGKVSDSVTTTTNLGILIPIYIDVLPAVYVADPTYTPVLKNSSGIVLQTAPWTKMTADISALDKTDIREGLALEASLALKADQATVALIPTNPLLTTDARLNTLDVAVSTRLAASGYTAPTTPPTAAQNATAVRSELTTELGRMDVAVSSRLAASGYVAPTTAPTAAQNATAVRSELATELGRIDATVGSRLAASGYTAPTAAPTSAQNATAVRDELATELGRIDSTVSSRLAASGYTVPDNVSIAAIKATTDATLDTTVSSRLAASGYIAPTTSPTAAQNATAVRSELAIELARIDAAITTRLAASGYTPGTNAPTSEQVAAAVRTELATELARIDAGVSTRLAASGYTSPDNTSIASIKNVTALIPALL